ncbi:hypothetical protein ACH41H_29145 [Streptomyces sp. NPDC020800]|uniref:hypothetical protein n=1 Tax=Streptomyces sp. NPDC020800 TaxID=3365092 RepID=UPI0037B76A55
MHLPSESQVVVFGAGALWFARSAPLGAGCADRYEVSLAALPYVQGTAQQPWFSQVPAVDANDPILVQLFGVLRTSVSASRTTAAIVSSGYSRRLCGSTSSGVSFLSSGIQR